MSVAILMNTCFEESETMLVTDFLRRFNIETTTFSLNKDLYISGMHNITCKADKLFNNDLSSFDMVFIPSGITLDYEILSLLNEFKNQNKCIASMSPLYKCDITSIGSATAFPMVFKMVEYFGIDTSTVKEKILYNFANGK